MDIVTSRKSVRSFLDEKVPDEIVRDLVAAATYAPTSCNQQLWQFVVIKDEAVKKQLVEEAGASLLISRAPVVIVVSYDGWNRKEALQAGAMAVQNILLAAASGGLGALALNSYGHEGKVRSITGLPDNQVICCFVLVGYPDGAAEAAARVPRRPVDEVLSLNRFSGTVGKRLSYDPDRWTVADLIAHQRYYCRKTSLGREMDSVHHLERDLVKQELSTLSGEALDLLSYDGAYLREFPAVRVTAADLCKETAAYTEEAVKLYTPDRRGSFRHAVLDLASGTISLAGKGGFDAATVLYKLERLPGNACDSLLRLAFEHVRPGGRVIVVARRKNLFLGSFLRAIRLILGDDVRKTGIYAFFGGYEPVSTGRVIRSLERAGWIDVQARTYFWIPPYFDRVLQMFLQYRRSGGTNYLHAARRENFWTRLLAGILSAQGLGKCRFGSVVVLRARKA